MSIEFDLMKIDLENRILDAMIKESLIEAQKKYCKDNSLPMFAPSDGKCFSCKRDTTNDKWINTLITSCSYCLISFCD